MAEKFSLKNYALRLSLLLGSIGGSTAGIVSIANSPGTPAPAPAPVTATTPPVESPPPATQQAGDVFDMYKESRAAAKGSTTLTKDQKDAYDYLISLYEQTGPGKVEEHDMFIRAIHGLSKLEPADKIAITGRLIYHGAHLGGKGIGLIADAVLYTSTLDDDKPMLFITDTTGTPRTLDEVLSKGMNAAPGYDIPNWAQPDNGNIPDDSRLNALHRVIEETVQHHHTIENMQTAPSAPAAAPDVPGTVPAPLVTVTPDAPAVSPARQQNHPADEHISADAYRFLKKVEDSGPKGKDGKPLWSVYDDGTGKPTQGYGQTGKNITFASPPIDEVTAEKWLHNSVAKYETVLTHFCAKHHIKQMTQAQRDAAVIFLYNTACDTDKKGPLAGGFGNALKKGDFTGAFAHEIPRWNHAAHQENKGLTIRRGAETAYAEAGVDAALQVLAIRDHDVRHKSLAEVKATITAMLASIPQEVQTAGVATPATKPKGRGRG